MVNGQKPKGCAQRHIVDGRHQTSDAGVAGVNADDDGEGVGEVGHKPRALSFPPAIEHR